MLSNVFHLIMNFMPYPFFLRTRGYDVDIVTLCFLTKTKEHKIRAGFQHTNHVHKKFFPIHFIEKIFRNLVKDKTFG